MIRGKTDFRAVRESVGMTQAALAAELGVQVRSIKRWESPEAPQQPPQDAWDVLVDAYEAQARAVAFAVDKAHELLAELPEGAEAEVCIPYWPDAAAYAARSTDSALGVAGDWRMANANARAAAAILRSRGLEVRFADPAGPYAFLDRPI